MILNELIDFFGDSEKGFSDDVAMLWIRFWVADILDEAEEQAREECVKICMAKWHNDREIRKFRERNVSLCGVNARGSLIEGVTEGLVKDVVKDKTSLAHRLQISGYGLSRISEEMGCGECLVAELLLKRKEIMARVLKGISKKEIEARYRQTSFSKSLAASAERKKRKNICVLEG